MDTLRPPHRVALTQQNPLYPQRAEVSERQIDWAVEDHAYAPNYYVHPSVIEA